jgi:predicted nucleic acid-binding Zn ribbon protein
MSETMKKSMWWWFWQTEKVEAMLEGMAAQGWHMIQASRSCTAFVFEKGAPRRVRYCADYQEAEKPEYLALLADAGWTMAYKGSGWYITDYARKNQSGAGAPKTDSTSSAGDAKPASDAASSTASSSTSSSDTAAKKD